MFDSIISWLEITLGTATALAFLAMIGLSICSARDQFLGDRRKQSKARKPRGARA